MSWSTYAQQKIGNNLGTLNPGAVLELESTNRGFLPSRVALTASNAWSLNGTATNGMLVYNTQTVTGANALTPGFYMWQDGSWVRIVTGTIGTTNNLTYAPTTRTLTSNVNGVSSDAVLPLATGSVTGLLSSADFTTFNAKENALTFSNGLTRTANAITLGGTLTGNTALTLAANNFTFGGATTGKVIVSGPAGSATSGLQLSNLLTAVTPAASSAGQRILTVDGSGNVILGTDFGSNNAGTVTNVSGTAPINVATGTTTPVISINALGITTDLLADNAVTTPKIADAAVTTAKIAPGTNGQYLTTVGGVTTWAALPAATVTGATNGTSLVAGNVELGGPLSKPTTITTSASNFLALAGLTAKTVQVDNNDSLLVVNAQGRVQYLPVSNLPANNIYNADGSLTGGRTVTLGTNNLTFNASSTGQVIVSGPSGNTAGLRLSNLTGAGTAGTAGQKVLSVNASGDVVLVTDFGTNNAGTVTNVTGTAPINVATGTTTPVISINALGITTGLIADNAVTTPKIADAAVTPTKIAPGTNGQFITTAGGVTTWATLPASTNIYSDNGTLAGNRTVNMADRTLAFTSTATTGSNHFSVDGNTFSVDAANNRVGIGTLTPTTTLEISANSAQGIFLRDNSPSEASPVIRVQGMRDDGNGSSAFAGGLALQHFRSTAPVGGNTALGNIYFGGNHSTGESSILYSASIGGVSEANFAGETTMPTGLVFRTGSTGSTIPTVNHKGIERMRITAQGNVGIGTAIPTSTLHVNGSTAYSIRKITQTGLTRALGLGAGQRTVEVAERTVLVNTFSNPEGIEIILPAPNTCAGREYIIRKVDETSNPVSFTFAGITGSNAIRVSDTSATAGSYINSLNYTKTLRIQSDGTDWYLID